MTCATGFDLAVKGIDPRLSIHDLRCVPGPTHTNVIFDCVRPVGCPLSAAELRERVSELVRERYPRAVCKIDRRRVPAVPAPVTTDLTEGTGGSVKPLSPLSS